MPNYYVPTNYYIDWSEWSVNRLQTLTIAERIRESNEDIEITESDETTICAFIRNPTTYFKKGLTFSPTGAYSPTYRINSASVYGNKGSNIFINSTQITPEYLLGTLCSKLLKYIAKNYQCHTVEMPEGRMIEAPVIPYNNTKIATLVKDILTKQQLAMQKKSTVYDYASHEQVEIDKLVYDAYGLDVADIAEVEAWYARRYPLPAAAQAANRAPAAAAS